jgi:hypothetical protein
MDRYTPLTAALTVGGGLLAAAFLPAAAAVAAPGDDAFTIGSTIFDPMTSSGAEGFDPVGPLNMAPPLLDLGGGKALGIIDLAPQNFELYSGTGSSATDLGSIDTNETVTNLLGLSNTEFTVESVVPATGVDASTLPAVGTVYDAFNLGNGWENVYTALPDVGSTSGSVTDTLVTPFGNIDLSSLFAGMNAANPLAPGDAFTGLQAGDSAIGANAFTIGTTTFDPFIGSGDTQVEGFAPVATLASAPPLLNLGGGQLVYSPSFPETPPTPFAPQDFDVYSGTGSSATELGTIHTAEDVTNLLGLTNTEFTVQSVDPVTGGDASTLPAVGTVYDAFNLGNGWENVYTATPDVGSTSGSVTDTLVTPFGNFDLSSMFGGINFANPFDPGDAFTGLQAGDSSVGADAFSPGGYVFDPFVESGDTSTEGFHVVPSLLGAAPLLNIGGASVGLGGGTPIDFAPQDFDVYNGTGSTDLGTITTGVNVSSLLGLANTEFTVTSVTPADGVTDAQLPGIGTVYDVFNLGNGWENIYTALPDVGGTGGSVTDTLVTPFGDVDLSSLFDGFNAALPLDPGDAFTGLLDAGSSAAVTALDPLAFLGL